MIRFNLIIAFCLLISQTVIGQSDSINYNPIGITPMPENCYLVYKKSKSGPYSGINKRNFTILTDKVLKNKKFKNYSYHIESDEIYLLLNDGIQPMKMVGYVLSNVEIPDSVANQISDNISENLFDYQLENEEKKCRYSYYRQIVKENNIVFFKAHKGFFNRHFLSQNIQLSSDEEWINVGVLLKDATELKKLLNQYTSPNKHTSPLVIHENYNNPTSVDTSCISKNTGGYCFINNTDIEYVIELEELKEEMRDHRTFVLNSKQRLKPKQKSCLYDMKAGVYQFTITYQQEIIKEGELKVLQCKSANFNIKN